MKLLWIPAVIAGLAGIFALVFGLVRTVIRRSEPYQEALGRARDNSELAMLLGSPLEEGLFPTGSLKVNGPYGRALLSIPIRGPNGKATVYVRALKQEGAWRYERIVCRVQGRELVL